MGSPPEKLEAQVVGGRSAADYTDDKGLERGSLPGRVPR